MIERQVEEDEEVKIEVEQKTKEGELVENEKNMKR